MKEPKILYQDEFLIAIDKPTGLLSVPGKNKSHCATKLLHDAGLPTLVVHRLDRDTSGIMLLARNSGVQSSLGKSFATRQVKKKYQAIVHGDVAQPSGEMELPIRKDMRHRLPPRYMVDPEWGKPAKTCWSVLERDSTTTRLELRPITGRSHQLRVHCASMGHPILGDMIYGVVRAERLMLHACELTFPHPRSGAILTIKAPSPF